MRKRIIKLILGVTLGITLIFGGVVANANNTTTIRANYSPIVGRVYIATRQLVKWHTNWLARNIK